MTSLLRSIASQAGFSNGRDWQPETGLADLTDKVAAVTGAAGIGFITIQELHKKGCKVFVLCRDQKKGQDAVDRILEANPESAPGNLVVVPFDLTDLKTAESAAETISQQTSRLDILVNNAGIMAWPYELKNGIEVQFANHMGHFALTKHLLPLLIKTSKLPGSSVRIVNVSSMGHKISPKPDFSSLEAVNKPLSSTWARYGQSKLANILFSVALQDRLKDEKIYVNSLHPGNINTTLSRGPTASYGCVAGMLQSVWGFFCMTPFEGAKTQLYLAGSPEVEEKNYRGMYFVPIATPGSTSAYAQDKTLAEELWKLSEDLVAQA